MTYRIPEDAPDAPQAIAARLIAEYPEFTHLADGEARIAILFDMEETFHCGRQVLGSANLPQVQGKLKAVFTWMVESMLGYRPDFLILIDEAWWQQADARLREILVFHELSHCAQKVDRDGAPRYDDEGRPVWGLAAHDVEEFTATVARYGAYSEEIRGFIEAANTGTGTI